MKLRLVPDRWSERTAVARTHIVRCHPDHGARQRRRHHHPRPPSVSFASLPRELPLPLRSLCVPLFCALAPFIFACWRLSAPACVGAAAAAVSDTDERMSHLEEGQVS